MPHAGRKNADEVLAFALAAGGTIRDACKAARVSQRTAYRRLDDPAFRQQVSAARDGMFQRATGQLADAASAAAQKLLTLLNCGVPSVELGAARSILEIGTKLRETVELEARITALEGHGNAA